MIEKKVNGVALARCYALLCAAKKAPPQEAGSKSSPDLPDSSSKTARPPRLKPPETGKQKATEEKRETKAQDNAHDIGDHDRSLN